MKVLKVFAKNVYNGKQLILRENATEEDFEQAIREEHEKIHYDINKIDLNLSELDYDTEWNKYYEKILDKCIEYARKWKVNYFGDYELVLIDDEEAIKTPDKIGTYTFYEMEE